MSEENPVDNSKEDAIKDTTVENNENKTVTVKKSTYNNMRKGIIIAIAVAAFLGGYSSATFDDDSDSEISREELEEMLSDIQVAQVPQPAKQPPQPQAPQIIKVSLDDDPVKGDPNAPVTLVEFSDFQCPFCSRFYHQTLSLIEQNYIDTGKVKLVYRDFPLDSIHPNARPAHIAAECADEQEMFWEYHDVLFEKQPEWQNLSSDNLSIRFSQYASELGLQAASFESCLQSPDMADEVNKDFLDAASYGATGTPTFFIGNEQDGFIKIVGAQPYATFQNAIENLLG